jgi:hypothetical protein
VSELTFAQRNAASKYDAVVDPRMVLDAVG